MSATAAVDFSALATTLESESALRERIRDAVREFESAVRTTTSILSGIHATLESDSLASRARQTLPAVQKAIAGIAELIPQWGFWRYCDMCVLSASFGVVLIGWLEADRLITKEEVSTALGIDPSWSDHFELGLEDYLLSLISLISELARLSPNSVTLASSVGAPITIPLRVSRFVKELNSGFLNLNLKNGNVRRRFDGIKYDLKSVEQVVYDCTLRGLMPAPEAPQKRPRTEENGVNGKDEVEMSA